jgi:hypothetical protein
MKNVTTIVATMAMLVSNVGFAQDNAQSKNGKMNNQKKTERNMDNGSCKPCPPKPCCTTYDKKPLKCSDAEKNMAGTECCADFQWGIAAGGLAVLGVMIGLTVSAASSNGPSYSQ